jgi:hypothetical protein
MYKSFITIFLIVLCSSVFAQSDILKQPQTDTIPYATVYVYRKVDKVTFLSTYHLLMTNFLFKDLKLSRLKNYTVIPVKVYQESKTQFHTTAETIESAFIITKLGQSYYVRCRFTSGLNVKAILDVVSKEQAEMDIEEMQKVAKQFEADYSKSN